MRKKSTRLLSAALAVCMMLSALPVGAFAAEPGAEEQENGASAQAEEDAVAIDATNFPDGAFRQYVADNFDKDKDGALNQTERNAVKEIRISNSGCTSLQGLKYFSKLTDLFCSDNNLTELDVSENPELKRLICYNNSLTSLNLNKNTKLESLNCNKNKLTVLDLRENKSLSWLRCNNNCLTSLDLRNNPQIGDLQVGFQRYQILANDDRTYDLHQLPGKFELDGVATGSWEGGTVDPTTWILKANSTTVTYKYKVDDEFCFPVTLDVHWHNYQWNHNGTKHWRECTTANCPGLTAEQVAKTTHDYTDAKDNDCNTCGYVRPLYTVTTVNATAKLESEAEELKAPVAAGTEVILTAGNAPEGKTFAGWKLYNVSDTESEITDETELAKLLKNGIATTATLTLTMPAYNVKAEPYYSNIPYNIKAVDCTVDKTEAAKGDTVTATRRALKANERFTGWTVTVNGVEQDTDTFLTPDANDPAKVRFTMPAENVEIKANFKGIPTLNIGDHVTANIDGSDASVPSGSTVPVGETVHLTAIAPDGQHFIGWTVKVGDEEQKADDFLTTPNANDPTKVTFTMPSENVEVTANFASNPTLNPTLRVGDHVTATIDGSDTPVPSGSAVPVGETVHLTAIAPEGQHFTGWTVKVGDEEQKADTFLTTPDADDPTKVTFTMPDKNVEVKANFADDPIPEPDPVGPSDTGNIQGAISAVVVGAAAGAIIYEAGTGIYRVINMPGIPMPSNRIELAELLWEHAGKPEPVSTALYSDIDEGDTDAQKAARWAVEQDLMKDDADNNKFHPAFPVSKLRTCLTWNAAKEKGLFDKTEE